MAHGDVSTWLKWGVSTWPTGGEHMAQFEVSTWLKTGGCTYSDCKPPKHPLVFVSWLDRPYWMSRLDHPAIGVRPVLPF